MTARTRDPHDLFGRRAARRRQALVRNLENGVQAVLVLAILAIVAVVVS